MSELEFIDIFADNLKDIMEEYGYSQIQLAKESKLNRSTIARYLQKEHMPTIKAVVNLSLALGCDINDLIPMYDFID